ncbi:hypothetical protein EWM64_g5341 [Hericium alpestre]|uniref:Glucanase n=1 Tax=Hericium alpestre TaxID=135208 RepID=A0A4Y9ZZ31_9AGAM|nr:hypothetical protein EWM64_g5341 [Hericium alpestre]
MFKFAALASFVTLVTSVSAQSPVYGQCGGQGWTGSTTCAAGSVCTFSNPYYSQCLPGSAAPPPPSSSPSSGPTPTSTPPTSTTSTGTSPSQPASTDNPFTGYELWLSPYYQAEVAAALPSITDASLKAKASSIADIPNFTWFDQVAKVPQLGDYLANATAIGQATGTKQLVQIVVYDLPDRDCAALASNGEFSIADNGQANYENYIDQIVAQIKQYPDVRVVAVIEPDSLANLVTNLNVAKCANAQTTYLACVNYAIKQLAAVDVIISSHRSTRTRGSPSQLRGLATNVANYNALSAATPDPITQGDPNYDEIHYINALAPELQSAGFSAHFIVDQGRSGQQDLRTAWGDWCNVKGAGFGTRPTTDTGSDLVDSIVWVKPGGESDGTSNSSSPRYDSHCGQSDATQPAPEAGTWFEAYFETLVSAANPPL